MKTYKRFRYPNEVISHTVWLYYRFQLSFRDIEEILASRGVVVSYETIRQWCKKFSTPISKNLKKQQQYGDSWFIDEVFIKIGGKPHYLWRAVDQDNQTLDILVQSKRNAKAASKLFRKIFKTQCSPRKITTDKLRSYPAAIRNLRLNSIHETAQYKNNIAEISHQPTRQRERQMRKFKSAAQAQRFLSSHAVINNHFRQQRHLLKASTYRTYCSHTDAVLRVFL